MFGGVSGHVRSFMCKTSHMVLYIARWFCVCITVGVVLCRACQAQLARSIYLHDVVNLKEGCLQDSGRAASYNAVLLTHQQAGDLVTLTLCPRNAVSDRLACSCCTAPVSRMFVAVGRLT